MLNNIFSRKSYTQQVAKMGIIEKANFYKKEFENLKSNNAIYYYNSINTDDSCRFAFCSV